MIMNYECWGFWAKGKESNVPFFATYGSQEFAEKQLTEMIDTHEILSKVYLVSSLKMTAEVVH